MLATKWLLGWRTICYIEKELYCVEVIKARIRDGLLDDAPIWDNARTFDGRPWRGCVDIITAGFPCQPFSLVGEQRAEQDERNLWPDTIRIIREVKPQFCLLENVCGLLSGRHGYFGTILKELAESGYDARWRVLSAAEVGAPHRRDRIWIMAYANSKPTVWIAKPRQECNPWYPEPQLGRVANGVANRVDRLRAIGNGQVPTVAREVWDLLSNG